MIKMVFFVLSCLVISNSTYACDIRDFKDRIDYSQEFSSLQNYLHFQNFRNSQSNTSDHDVDVNFDGIGGIWSDSETQMSTQELFTMLSFSSETSTSEAYVANYLSSESKESYIECLSKDTTGITVETVHANDRFVELKFSYNRTATGPRTVPVTIQARGITKNNSAPPAKLKDGIAVTFEYERQPNSEFRVQIQSSVVAVNKASQRVSKPFKAPSNLIVLHHRVWADGTTFRQAPNKYVNTVDVVTLPLEDSAKRINVFSGPHSGTITAFVDVFKNGEYVSWWLWNARDDENWRGAKQLFGRSNAHMNGCGTPIPCDYYYSTQKLR